MGIDLNNALKISASGMKAQGTRLRVISENIANQDSVGRTGGADPYRRKTIVFKDVMDRQLGIDLVQVAKIGRDEGNFKISYEPYHPLASCIDPSISNFSMRKQHRIFRCLDHISRTRSSPSRLLSDFHVIRNHFKSLNILVKWL